MRHTDSRFSLLHNDWYGKHSSKPMWQSPVIIYHKHIIIRQLIITHTFNALKVTLIPFALKPWSNGLASRRKFWTCVQLAFRLATHLRRLAWTAEVFYCLDTQRKSTQVICCDKSALTNDMREIYGFLRLTSRLANPFGHPSQVRT